MCNDILKGVNLASIKHIFDLGRVSYDRKGLDISDIFPRSICNNNLSS